MGSNSVILSGINTAQAQLQTSFHNVANATNPDHCRLVQTAQSVYVNGVGMGVTVSPVERLVDEAQLAEYQQATSVQAFYTTKAEVAGTIQNIIGSTKDDRSFSEQLKTFQRNCESVANDPNVLNKQTSLLNSAQSLCQQGAFVTSQLTQVRTRYDATMADIVQQANVQLKTIYDLNATITAGSMPNSASNVEDAKNARDAAVRQLGTFMDIRTQMLSGGVMQILTPQSNELVGYTLSSLNFTPSIGVSPQSTYNANPALTTLNAILLNNDYGQPIDITNAFSYGQLAACVEARDQTIPHLQAEFDQLMTTVRDTVNTIHNNGTGFPPPTHLAGTKLFATPATTAFQGTGTIRFGVVDRTMEKFVTNYDLDLTALGATTVQNLAANINTALSAATGNAVTCTITNNGGLTLNSTHSNYGIGLVSLNGDATETTTGLGISRYFGLNDFFVTASNGLPASSTAPAGVAAQLSVRSDIAANPSLLASGMLSAITPTLPTTIAINARDGSNMNAIARTLTSAQNFNAVGDLPAISSTVVGYASQIIATHALQTDQVNKQLKTADQAYEQIQMDFSRTSGVNVQQEMSLIIDLQAYYAACTRCLEMSSENLTRLINIV